MKTDLHRQYFLAGLTNMARCQQWTNPRREAHWGAAVLAACFFAEGSIADIECKGEVYRQLDLFIESHRDGFEPPFSQAPSVDYVAPLTAALEQTVDRLCWVGHNVIYTALSLNALKRVPAVASSDLITGLVSLIESFGRSIPGRSWIGWTTSEVQRATIEQAAFPDLTTPSAVSGFVLEELSAFRRIVRAESHHDLIAHMLDFAQAINLLHDLGHEALFHRALVPLKVLVTVLRSSQNLGRDGSETVSSPVDRPPLVDTATLADDALTARYWQRDFSVYGWDGGHTFKFSYAYYDHASRVSNDLRARSLPNFRKILGGSNRLRLEAA